MSFTNKYQNHVGSSYSYKLVCADDKLWSRKVNFALILWKNILTNNLWWLKKMIKISKTLVNVKFVIMVMLRVMLNGCAYRDCNNNVKLNRNIFIAFYILKNYDSHLIMQELSKFKFKINIILNVLKKYLSFSINNKLIFLDSFKFLSFSLDNLFKSLSK